MKPSQEVEGDLQRHGVSRVPTAATPTNKLFAVVSEFLTELEAHLDEGGPITIGEARRLLAIVLSLKGDMNDSAESDTAAWAKLYQSLCNAETRLLDISSGQPTAFSRKWSMPRQSRKTL